MCALQLGRAEQLVDEEIRGQQAAAAAAEAQAQAVAAAALAVGETVILMTPPFYPYSNT